MKYSCSIVIQLNIRSLSLPSLHNKLMVRNVLPVTCTPCLCLTHSCMFYIKHKQLSSTVIMSSCERHSQGFLGGVKLLKMVLVSRGGDREEVISMVRSCGRK